jgi:hypothetical protein
MRPNWESHATWDDLIANDGKARKKVCFWFQNPAVHVSVYGGFRCQIISDLQFLSDPDQNHTHMATYS